MYRDLFISIKKRLIRQPRPAELTKKQVKAIKSARIRICKDIDRDIKGRDTFDKKRYYSHVGHIDNRICISSDFSKLPLKYQKGVLLHEIGHLMTGCGSEPDADLIMATVYGIVICYDNDRELEYVDNFRI